MRPTSRLFATVKSASKYLEPNAPTGLTGLPTHPAPRPALLFTYNQTLRKLKQLPASSVYRQSTENLTKHRMQIVESTKPPGYDEWVQRVQKQIDANPAAYSKFKKDDGSFAHSELAVPQEEVWDGKITRKSAAKEGSNTQSEAEAKARAVETEVTRVDKEAAEGTLPKVSDLEVEPALTAEQYVTFFALLRTSH